MASLRKKYSTHIEVGPRQEEPPVTSPPAITAAELPPPAVEPKPIEPMVESDPVRESERSALKARLDEMNRAEQLAKAPPPPPQRAAEPPPQQQQQPEMPASVQRWLAEHPQYMDPSDQIAQLEINLATAKCVRDGLTWNDDDFLPTIERHLNLRPATNGHAESRPTLQPTNHAPRPAVPQRQSVRPMAAPVSAPPTREAPSMTTGRAPTYRAPLSKEELEIAAQSGISPEEYQRNKERWAKMKAEGAQ